jgi:hypothetical protein
MLIKEKIFRAKKILKWKMGQVSAQFEGTAYRDFLPLFLFHPTSTALTHLDTLQSFRI